MAMLTVTLTDATFERLHDIALQMQVAPEDLARLGVEDLIATPEGEVARLMDRVLAKNAELYQRLA